MTQKWQGCLQSKMYDAAVIGAGPAGLMAARQLPKNSSFIVIDKKERIGMPLKCGEGVREREFIHLFGSKDFPFVRNSVHKHEAVYKNIIRVFPADYLQLDRPEFEQWLAEPIMDKVILSTKCEELIINRNFAEVITDRERIKARMVILASGCNFNIQRKYGLMKKEPFLFVCYGGIYKNHGLASDKFYAYFDDKYLGYLWIFPKNQHIANVGFGTVVKGVNVKKELIGLLKEINPRMRLISSYGGIVPCSGPIDKTYYKRLLVCGDAAGLVYAGTGEGIYFALESGRIAGQVASRAIRMNRFDKGLLKAYEKRWKKSFGRLMKAGIIFRDLQYIAFKRKRIRELFIMPSDKEIKGMISYGKVPLKARVVWWVWRVLRLF